MAQNLGDFLATYNPEYTDKSLERKNATADYLIQAANQASNPFIAFLAGAVGNYQKDQVAKKQGVADASELDLKKALLLNEDTQKDRTYDLQKQQLGISSQELGIKKDELGLKKSQEAQKLDVRTKLSKYLMGDTTEIPQGPASPAGDFIPPKKTSNMDSLQNLDQAAIIAAASGDKEFADTLASVAKNKAKETGSGMTSKNTIQAEGAVRQDFLNLSKPYVVQRDNYGKIKESAKDPSAAGDISLIFSYMKLLDPSSVVREGEFATAANAGGADQRTISLYNKAISGETLSQDIRNDFVGRADKLWKQAESQQEVNSKNFRDVAKRSGLNPENVVIDLGFKAPKEEAAKLTSEGMTYHGINKKTGNKVFQDKAGNLYEDTK